MRGLFFNAQPTTDIVAHPSGFDREYDSDDFNRYMGVFFGNGVFVRNDPDACKVTASGLALTVTPGIALVDGGQCHFEPGDGLTITQGDGLYSVMCRRNNAAAVRAFELVAIRGEGEYPAPVRDGDLYDLCLAHVQVVDGVGTVTDTREDRELCGFAALTGQPPYYPPDEANLPYVLWLYVLGLPMTPEQVEAVEGNPSLMEIFNQSRIVQAIQMATKEEAEAGEDNSKLMTPLRTKEAIDASYKVGDIKTTVGPAPSLDWLPCNGATLVNTVYPDLDKVCRAQNRAPYTTQATVSTVNTSNHMGGWERDTELFLLYLIRTSDSAVLYKYDKASKANTRIDPTNPYVSSSGLTAVIGSNYTIYTRGQNGSSNATFVVIDPSGNTGTAISVTLPALYFTAYYSVAYLMGPNTIRMFAFAPSSNLIRVFDIIVSANSVSTQDVTVSGISAINGIGISNGYLYLAVNNQSSSVRRCLLAEVAPAAFSTVSIPETIGGSTNGLYSFTDIFGNLVFIGADTPYKLAIFTNDGEMFITSGVGSNTWPTGFVWFNDRNYGMLFSSNRMVAFNKDIMLPGVPFSDSRGMSGGWGILHGSSVTTVSIVKYYLDIKLPTLIDATTASYASIKVK